MNNIIPFPYEGHAVRFNLDGWINATAAAAMFGQEPRDWLRLHETESYIRALAKHLGLPFEPKMVPRKKSEKVSGGNSGFRPELSNCKGLVVTRRGSPANGGGTWLHPKLAVAFARWLNADFAVWCDMRVDALLHGDLTLREQFDRACRALDCAKDLASLNGRELSMWRKRKPALTRDVEHWRDQLQMSFSLENRA